MDTRLRIIVGSVVAVVGLVVLGIGVFHALSVAPDNANAVQFASNVCVASLAIGGVLFLVGALLTAGLILKKVSIPKVGEFELEDVSIGPGPHPAPVQPKGRPTLPAQVQADQAQLMPTLPGARRGDYRLCETLASASLDVAQLAMTPIYTLDENFRIVDWNKALSLAFDFTMEGFRGQTVAEWIFFLANYKQVAEHGTRDFKDKTPDEYPPIHVEELVFESVRYGRITATKRAHKVHNDDQSYAGWFVPLHLEFSDGRQKEQYRMDLLATLRDDLTWSEYALAYDVLNKSKVYPELLSMILGEIGPLSPIPANAHVLDLGAGTGNLSAKLAGSGRIIFAVENNPTMLGLLKKKYSHELRSDTEGPGVIPVRQDVCSLFGFPTEYFHYAILNNVLYTIEDPSPCVEATYECLCEGGEIRVSGPHAETDLTVLLEKVKEELKAGPGLTGDVREKYEKVKLINEVYLKPRLCRWTMEQVEDMLRKAGFEEITARKPDAYAGQAMIVGARK